MNARTFLLACTVAGFVNAAPASAAQYRFLFQGSESLAMQSATQGQPAGYAGLPPAPGNLNAGCASCGGSNCPYHGAGTPNQIVTFLHPYTGKAVTVPLTLPIGRPRLLTRSDRIVYDYGLLNHKVIVKFLPNGLVDVNYRG